MSCDQPAEVILLFLLDGNGAGWLGSSRVISAAGADGDARAFGSELELAERPVVVWVGSGEADFVERAEFGRNQRQGGADIGAGGVEGYAACIGRQTVHLSDPVAIAGGGKAVAELGETDSVNERVSGLGGFDSLNYIAGAGVVFAIAEDDERFSGSGFHHLQRRRVVNSVEQGGAAAAGIVRFQFNKVCPRLVFAVAIEADQEVGGGRSEVCGYAHPVGEADQKRFIAGRQCFFGEGGEVFAVFMIEALLAAAHVEQDGEF